MANCTECNVKLTGSNFKKSAVRSSNKLERFIQCEGCSNVMIGTFTRVVGGLKSVQSTPKDKSTETKEMIEEAKKLFKAEGIKVGSVEYTKDVKIVDDEDEELIDDGCLDEDESTDDTVVDGDTVSDVQEESTEEKTEAVAEETPACNDEPTRDYDSDAIKSVYCERCNRLSKQLEAIMGEQAKTKEEEDVMIRGLIRLLKALGK